MSKPYMCGDEVPIYIPEGGCDCNYTLRKVEDADYYATYNLMLNGSHVGDTIQVPHDKVLISGTVETVVNPNSPYWGAEVGDYYLDMVIENESNHVYISLKDLKGGGYIIVDDISDLPDPGDPRYIYLVDTGDGYEQYVWSDGQWVDLGGTSVDLSNYYTKTQVDALIAQMSLVAYPVGSLYMSTNSADPSTFFGGTWEAIEDRFLLAAGSTYTAGATGGYANATLPEHAHWVEEDYTNYAGTHAHSVGWDWSKGSGSEYAYTKSSGRSTFERITSSNGDHRHYIPGRWTDERGESAYGKNLPPYLVVHVWKRTA